MREIESMNECEIASLIEEMKNDGRTTEETEGRKRAGNRKMWKLLDLGLYNFHILPTIHKIYTIFAKIKLYNGTIINNEKENISQKSSSIKHTMAH